MTQSEEDRQEFEFLFARSGLQQKQLSALLGMSAVQVNRWMKEDRKDSSAPPFYAIQFLRCYVMLPAAARAQLPIRTLEKRAA